MMLYTELTVNNVGGDDVIVIDDGSLSLTLPPVNVTGKDHNS